MSAASAIGLVSESLREMLAGEMTVRPPVPITVLGPDESSVGRRINLFLYKVTENPYLRNLDWQVRPGAADRLMPPPLSLNLGYLLTAYAPNDQHSGNANAQQLLGEAMRVLYDNPVVPAEYLVTGLDEAGEQIRVVHAPLDTEEISRIWSTFTQPYRTSVRYDISVVQIDATDRDQVVAKRVREVAAPDVRVPFRPPVVDAMTAASGRAGTRLRFAGQNLHGWRATVSIAGETLLDDAELTDDVFTADPPAQLSAGLHQVQVDVSGLFRRAFVFEAP